MIRLVRRLVPVTGTYHGPSFFIREPAGPGAARRLATPLFVVLVLVETTDLIFAVDSIPAVFAVTRDPFLVYSSNVFAILGLRALYFLLSGVIGKFRYLKFGLSVVLIFVGAKMLLADVYKVPIGLSLGVVAGILADLDRRVAAVSGRSRAHRRSCTMPHQEQGPEPNSPQSRRPRGAAAER